MLTDLLTEHSQWLGYIAIFSVLALVAAILLLPIMVGALPDDYFKGEHRHQNRQKHPTIVRRLLVVTKNLMGFILVLLGVLMLVLPGQGLLTILIGMIMMDYPGKYKLERKLVAQPKILSTMNWLRRKQNKSEFELN